MRSLVRGFLRSLYLGLFLILFFTTAKAQFKASIQGTVLDASGAIVPNAAITVTNIETGHELLVLGSEAGFYRVSALAPGKYTLSVERQGFKKKIIKEVVVNAEEARGVNIVLEPGELTDAVTITGESISQLQTENANVNRNITTLEVLRLPQFGRDPYELVRLTPGVFGQGARSGSGGAVNLPNTTGPGGSSTSVFQVENQVPVSANGQRVSNNNFQLDGVSVNSLGWGGAAVVTPNQESVKEVQVLSSSYSAEDGRNSGAQIKVISQNGTNTFHGSGFFKYSEPGLNAFNKYGGSTANVNINAPPVRVERRFRQFGGSLGGPIYLPRFGEGGPAYWSGQNRLFFFFSYEGLREKTNNTFNNYVETPEYRASVLQLRANSVTAGVLRASGVEPRISQLLPIDCGIYGNNAARCRVVPGGIDIGSITGATGQYVPGETGGGFDGIPDLQFAQLFNPIQTRGDQFNTRIDFNHGNNMFAVSTYFTRRSDEASDRGARSRSMADTTFKPQNAAVTFTFNRTITATILNEARVNFTRFAFNQVEASPDVNYGIPRVQIEGLPLPDRIEFGAPRGETNPGIFAQNTYAFRDTLTWVRGAQTWKFGAELTREQNNNNLVGGARPIYSFVGLFNLANDTPVFEGINTDPNNGLPANAQRYLRTQSYGFFGQTDWKVRPNFTLNLGLRYEYFTPLREKEGRLSNLVFGSNGLVNSKVVVVDELFKPDRNNFAPKLGFAYSPGRLGDKFVARGGFGVAFNRVPNVLFDNARGNPPYFARNSLCCGTAGNPFAGGTILYTLGTGLLGYPVNPALARGIDPITGGVRGVAVEIYGTPEEEPNSYVYLYSLDLQYELPWSLQATLGYQGSAGHKLIRIVNQNYIYPNNPSFQPVFFLQPDVNSNYNAMNARLTRRFSNGVQFDTIYRWAKSIDTLSYEGPGFVTNQTFPQDLSTERGPSDYDTRHYLTFSGLWDLPIFRNRSDLVGTLLGGWQINGIVTWNTGFPFTPVTARPSLVTPGGRTLSPIRPIQYFGGALEDTSDEAFIRPGGNFPGGGERYFAITGTAQRPGIGRNSFRGPGYSSIDLSLVKQFKFTETSALDIRANFFNAFNMLNVAHIPFGTAGAVIENPNFGRSPNGLAGRVIEFQARIFF